MEKGQFKIFKLVESFSFNGKFNIFKNNENSYSEYIIVFSLSVIMNI